jgi:hypothetical protein
MFSKSPLCSSLIITSFPLPWFLATINLSFISKILSFQQYKQNRIIYCLLSFFFFLLSMMPIQDIACISSLFFYCSVVFNCMDMPQYVYSLRNYRIFDFCPDICYYK